MNAGSKGSRVSVIEGEVHVQRGTSNESLRPGQQIATNPAMGTIPVSDEIAWSQNRDVHLALLKEFVNFSQDLGLRIGSQQMRHTSNLVPLVPATTLVFASLPNVSQPLSESYAAMKQRIAENPALKEWWDQNPAASKEESASTKCSQRVTRLGAFLGPEIVLAAAPTRADGPPPVLLADVTRPNELVTALQDDFERMSGRVRETPISRSSTARQNSSNLYHVQCADRLYGQSTDGRLRQAARSEHSALFVSFPKRAASPSPRSISVSRKPTAKESAG